MEKHSYDLIFLNHKDSLWLKIKCSHISEISMSIVHSIAMYEAF